MLGSGYDVIVIGAGPAGLTAGMYCSRARLSTCIIDRETIGGELVNREMIENYPGYPEGILGPELAANMVAQATRYGAEIRLDEVEGVDWAPGERVVRTASDTLECRAVIVANGTHPRRLAVPGEQEYANRGVFYCATCDGPGFADRVVTVAGGGDSGLTEALLLARYASRVIVLEVMPQLTATKILQERVRDEPKIEIRCGVKIQAVRGNGQMNGLDLVDVETDRKSVLEADGLLVHVGLEANTGFLRGCLPLDERGQVITDEFMRTVIPDVFAAGDIRHNSPMQVATAVGDGATAALSLCRSLRTRQDIRSS